jgi:hypothetical protein
MLDLQAKLVLVSYKLIQVSHILKFMLVNGVTCISTNNIATGMVCGSQVRFQSTKNTFSFCQTEIISIATA